ncbi:uncharacterized protein [Physcomitrium patens]|uniref:uncharacterized protein isoform X2 n=1 Tax=Physcomitrium patens TaxID=3218 RepID=UPI003CCCEF73
MTNVRNIDARIIRYGMNSLSWSLMTWKMEKLWLFCSMKRPLKNFRCWVTVNFSCRHFRRDESQNDGQKFTRVRNVTVACMTASTGDRFSRKGRMWELIRGDIDGHSGYTQQLESSMGRKL